MLISARNQCIGLMMTDVFKELFQKEYGEEIESFKRVDQQFEGFKKWLTNTSLAGLAFAFTIFFQVKSQGNLPHQVLAAATLIFLIVAALAGFLARGKAELERLITDSKAIYTLLIPIRDMLENSEEVTHESRVKLVNLFDKLVLVGNPDQNKDVQGSPFADLILVVVIFIALLFGLSCLCVYICLHFFSSY